MAYKNIFLLFGIIAIGCGNVFAVSPYATTIGMNTPKKSFLSAASFPTTAADASFVARMENKRVDYEKYKDLSPYHPLLLESEEDSINRETQRMIAIEKQDRITMSHGDWCDKYPLDPTCNPSPNEYENIIAIGDKTPTPQKQLLQSNDIIYNHETIGGGPVQLGNKSHGYDCFLPAATDTGLSNKIYTTGKYAKIDPAFEKGLITAFRKEGTCGQIAGDAGGYTCFGIAQNYNPDIDVKNITRADAEDIYYNRYYTKYNIDKLPDSVRADAFLLTMGAGPARLNILRRVVGVPEKNVKRESPAVDDELVRAVENYPGDLHAAFMDAQQQFYIEAAKKYQNTVLKGYMNAIKLKRENGCHVIPTTPIYR